MANSAEDAKAGFDAVVDSLRARGQAEEVAQDPMAAALAQSGINLSALGIRGDGREATFSGAQVVRDERAGPVNER